MLNQEEALKVFLYDGEVPFDNNAKEGTLHSFCLHKYAWNHSFRYLDYVLTVLKDH